MPEKEVTGNKHNEILLALEHANGISKIRSIPYREITKNKISLLSALSYSS